MSAGDGPVPSEWVRAPRQARSEATLLRFLEATAELLSERPFSEISVNDIVERAGRTVGSFYGRFDDKMAVLRVLAEQVAAELVRQANDYWTIENWRGRPVTDLLAASANAVVDAYRQAGPVFHAVAIHAPGDDGFRELRMGVWMVCADRFGEVVAHHVDEIDHPDPIRAGQLAMTSMLAMSDVRLLYGSEVRPSLTSDDDVAAELLELVTGIVRPRR